MNSYVRLLVLACAVATLGGAVMTAPAGASCSNARIVPSPASLESARHATLCLINAQRRQRHLRRLRTSARVARAASQHAIDMVRRHYFSHTTPAGLTVTDRVRHTSYTSTRGQLRAGENIAWGGGRLATPLQTVRRWMRSPQHRRNILSRSYRHIGVGIALGSPGFGSGGATYAVNFAG